MKRHLLSFCLSSSFTLLASAQTTHYSTGFETPTFTVGTLAGSTFSNGQDGWLATGEVNTSPILSKIAVQNASTHGGAQGVSIDATGQPCAYAHIRRNTFVNVTASEPILDIAFDMRLAEAASSRSEWGIQAQAGPGPGSGLLEWWIDVAGELHVTSPSGGVATGVILQRDRWYRMLTRVNYNAQTTSVFVDGQSAVTVPALSAAQFWFHGFTSLMFIDPGDDRMDVDDFSVVTHDGSVVANYCTAGTSTHGCVAQLSATGVPSASATSGFAVQATQLEGGVSATMFYGVSGRVAWPWGPGSSSFLCVKSPTQRLGVANTQGTSTNCDGALFFDVLDFFATHPSALGQPLNAGATVNTQVWYRDPAAVKSTNLSNALEFTMLP